jgi:flagellar biogenesis protein FliO
MIPPLFGDMNELMKSGLSENDKKEIVELIQIFDPTLVRAETYDTRKRDLNFDEYDYDESPRKRGGHKSKKHKKQSRRKNMKKQSRKNKKYTR